MARNTQPPPPKAASLSGDQMRSAIIRIDKRIAELEAFDPKTVSQMSSPEVRSLETGIEATLASVFGHGSIEYNRYRRATHIDYTTIVFGGGPPPSYKVQDAILRNKASSLATLKQATKDLEEEIEHSAPVSAPPETAVASKVSNKVFLVHGRDNEAKSEVARFLEKIGIEVIILHERANLGRHLLTKFEEEASDVGFAVVLITPDDEGGLSGSAALEPRARQNVIFELGFFIGKLGASNVAPLVKADVVRPSDFDGIGYISLDANGGWKGLVARELKGAKIPFNADKVFEA